MSLCLASGGKVVMLAVSAFTLSWTHSVEKIEWQEDWRLTGDGLKLVEARVKGSGAGMEPPEDARFDGQWWRYDPARAPLKELVLARSGVTTSDWQICDGGSCRDIDEIVGAGSTPVELSVCP